MNEKIQILNAKLEKLSERVNGETGEDFFYIVDELVEEYEILKEEYDQISGDIVPEFPAFSNDFKKSKKLDRKMVIIQKDFEKTARYLYSDVFGRISRSYVGSLR